MQNKTVSFLCKASVAACKIHFFVVVKFGILQLDKKMPIINAGRSKDFAHYGLKSIINILVF